MNAEDFKLVAYNLSAYIGGHVLMLSAAWLALRLSGSLQ